jgi:TRAP-type uncharacterized transport system substrate-binding protein
MTLDARKLSAFGRSAIAGIMALSWWITPGLAAAPVSDADNRGIVELETDSSAGISIRIAEDLASLVDDGSTRRVVPVVGRSARQNLTDLVALRGIDMAILQTDMLDSLRQQRSVPGLETSFTYVARLYNEEFHLLAGPDIKSVGDLARKKVAVGIRGSGTSVTAQKLFDLLKLQIVPVFDRPEVSLEKLRAGEIDAVAFVGGKPAPLLRQMQPDERLHFVAVPLNTDIVNTYVPTVLNADDYPNLVPPGQSVDTIAVGLLLAVARLSPDTERYRNVSNFVDIFFTQFRTLLEPGHHPKWHEINLAAEAPGWIRFPPAQAWLDRNGAVAKVSPQDLKTMFARFLDFRQQANGGVAVSEEEKVKLFNEFQRWQAGQSRP